ncbi:F-box domain-containing protein [Magnaporthiopsis poae ATCC 64411]|uniref:F-box domain-containing protein n=1 Tax=Magnaporthiopsis poae (strain ATCC 64411 / 73-15) TaxID=644358 RepID=A0A0C4E4X8_MAGP6|nr:F-box domain-containing protein [Magnaporthiopsis poae ATCC 64411]
MGFLPTSIRKMKFFRRKDKKKDAASFEDDDGAVAHDAYRHGNGHGGGAGRLHAPSPASTRLLALIPDTVLNRIFAFVCPHSEDETYETHELSGLVDACMLCDMRDLAHCGAVCQQWRQPARRRLYHSIRIDAVHFCEREIYLSDKRKRRSFFDRNGQPEDPARMRLKLLCRTLRDDPTRLGVLVRYFKTSYMLRESSQADLARTIAVLPNLLYVDLPEGLYADEYAYLTLRLEVQARCRNLRKMTYTAGAERSFEKLATGIWPDLEVLELVRLQVDPVTLRHVIGSLSNLQALKVTKLVGFVDEVLFPPPHEMVPPFPALEELMLKNVSGLTVEGLKQYLASPDARARLKTLNLTHTGVGVWDLHKVLSLATSLTNLVVVDSVASALPAAAGTHDIPPLRSRSLRTLNWEITAKSSAGILGPSAKATYYNYLSGSLLSGGLPTLSAVYVRDQNFPESLLGMPLPPTPAFAGGAFAARPSTSGSPSGAQTRNAAFGPSAPKPFAKGHNPRFSSNNPFAAMIPTQQIQTLEVFTKGDNESGWNIVRVPGGYGGGEGRHRRGNSFGSINVPERPHSSYGLTSQSVMAWRTSGDTRRSVFMGDGAGGFLAVPDTASGGQPHAFTPAERRGSSSSARRPTLGPGSSGGGSTTADEWRLPYGTPEKKKDRKDLWR